MKDKAIGIYEVEGYTFTIWADYSKDTPYLTTIESKDGWVVDKGWHKFDEDSYEWAMETIADRVRE